MAELVDISNLLFHRELPRDTSADLSSPPSVHSEPSTIVENQVDSDAALLPDVASSLLVDGSELPGPEHLIPLPEVHQVEQPLSSPPISQGELLETTPESQAKHREPQESSPLVSPPTVGIEPVAAPSQGELAPLSSAGLAKRLGVDAATISRNKDKSAEHFRRWSRKRDPNGIAWEYRLTAKLKYHPVI